MPGRRNHTRDDLISASTDLLYEIEMLGHTAQLLYHGGPKWASPYWINRTTGHAFVESFCVHARSLMLFFFPSGSAARTT